MQASNRVRAALRSIAVLSVCAVVGTTLLSGCGGGSDGGSGQDPTYDITSARAPVQAANPSGRYAGQLARCVYAKQLQLSELCPLSTLPLIGQETDDVGVETIMDRLVVSHPWMAQRFRELLLMLPPESLDLFRSVTAVVIASDQPGSQFLSATFGIYLDAHDLWLSDSERQTVQDAPATPAGPPFKYRRFERGRKVTVVAPAPTSAPRMLEDIQYTVAATLYVATAFAVEVVVPDAAQGLSRDLRPVEIYGARQSQRLGQALWRQFPLQSTLLYQIADLIFGGKATPEILAIEPEAVAAAYMANGAIRTRDFRYANIDAADLIGVAALKYFLGVDLETAIVRAAAQADGDNEIVWGQRDRVADANVKPRAQLVMERAFPKIHDWAGYFNDLPPPQALEAGKGWQETAPATPGSPPPTDCPVGGNCVGPIVGPGNTL